jgi:hypothetical protein
MGNQRGRQAQNQPKTSDRQPGQATPAVTCAQEPEEAVQELLGSRAASWQLRSQMQSGNQAQPLHQMVQSISPVSPRVQGKPMFRGVSQEWGSTSSGLVVQPKMTIGAPNDKYEQEADRIASQVVSRINSSSVQQEGDRSTVQRMGKEADELQRKPLLQRDTSPEGVEEKQKYPLSLMRSPDGEMEASAELDSEIAQERGRGSPLDATIREQIEQAFGADFRKVTVHTDTRSDQLNRSIQAKAFTTGQDIFFSKGAYQPWSKRGQELLAHELTHVVQQNGGVWQTASVQTPPAVIYPSHAHPRQDMDKNGRGPENARSSAGTDMGRTRPQQSAYALPPVDLLASTSLRAPIQTKMDVSGFMAHRDILDISTRADTGVRTDLIQRTPKFIKKFLRWIGVMAPPAPAGRAAPSVADLEAFVTAYEKARFYHRTLTPANVSSLEEHGLLNFTDRQKIFNTDIAGMSLQFRDSRFAGDEKKGVYLGPKQFMIDEQLTDNFIRAYLDSDRTKIFAPNAFDVPPDALQRDKEFPRGYVTRNSIPSSNVLGRPMMDLLSSAETNEVDRERLLSILNAVRSQYDGPQPTEEEMIEMLKLAIEQRRLSNAGFDNK